jgi:hypothetical protein
MPLARLAQYQHCLLRRNAVRTVWCRSSQGDPDLGAVLQQLREAWIAKAAKSDPTR